MLHKIQLPGISLLFSVLLFLPGCASMATKSVPPASPSIDAIDFPEISPPGPTGPKYGTKPGSKNPLTHDDVTVEVTSISEYLDDDEIRILCTAPTGSEVEFRAIPRGALVKISNGTDHIVTLGQRADLLGTVILLEDENGRMYPLHNQETWRQEFRESIEKYYGGSFALTLRDHRQTSQARIDDYVKTLNGPYSEQYKAYKSSHGSYSLLSIFNPLFWVGALLGITVNPPLDTDLSPESITAVRVPLLQARIETEQGVAQADLIELGAACQSRAQGWELPQQYGMVMSGEYPVIRILPSRKLQFYVPLKPVERYPDIFRFQLFDLVTKVDQVGNPTRRSTFVIELER